MSSGSVSSATTDQSTVHYARPHKPTQSANTSVNSDASDRVPGIQYPTVTVSRSPRLTAKSSTSPSSSIGYHRSVPYSVTQLQYDNMKNRCKMLDMENQRLMNTQSELVADANRRVEMHVNEIRMVKQENKNLTTTNKELRDLCCFLDDDRQRARRLAREWQKFGRYTSHVMRQEMHTYQQRVTELENRVRETVRENEELRQLCLYLDEQRQCIAGRVPDDESEDLGCGSSERSTDSENMKPESEQIGYNPQKENALRLLSEQISSGVGAQSESACDSRRDDETTRETDKMINYIQSLESRIRHLEMSTAQADTFWTSVSNVASDSDEKTIIDRWNDSVENDDDIDDVNRRQKKMHVSTTSTMTSSGTTYGSSETDGESAVYVMGDEIDAMGSLEVRTLNKIDEEERPDDEAEMPPPCAPLSASLLSVGRLSMTTDCDVSSYSSIIDRSLTRSASTSHSPSLKAPLFTPRSSSVERSAMSDAVRVLRIHEIAQKSERDQTARQENSIVKHMCQVAWNKLDEISAHNGKDISDV